MRTQIGVAKIQSPSFKHVVRTFFLVLFSTESTQIRSFAKNFQSSDHSAPKKKPSAMSTNKITTPNHCEIFTQIRHFHSIFEIQKASNFRASQPITGSRPFLIQFRLGNGDDGFHSSFFRQTLETWGVILLRAATSVEQSDIVLSLHKMLSGNICLC